MKYTKEQMEHMLEYAKKWYPPGTKLKFIGSTNHDSYDFTVDNVDPRWERCLNPKEIYANNGHGRLFGRLKDDIFIWATIVDGPQPPPYIPLGEIINYEIY